MTKIRNMRNVKKVAAIIGTAALIFSLTACGAQTAAAGGAASAASEAVESVAASAITGRIDSVEGNVVTLTLGEYTQGQGQMGGMPGQMNGEMPAMPESMEGEMPQMNGEMPAMPEGAEGEMPAMTEGMEGQMPGQGGPGMGAGGLFVAGDETITVDLTGITLTDETGAALDISSLTKNTIVSVTIDEDASSAVVQILMPGQQNGRKSASKSDSSKSGSRPSGGPSGSFGGSSAAAEGSAATTLDADGTYTAETYTSSGDDENALKVDGAAVTLDKVTVDKSAGSSSNTENGDFYGINAAVLATNGATLTITDAEISSSVKNGNGVFSYGSGTTVNISDSTITTTGDNSGGIQTTGGGTTNANNLTVTTSGNSSAAIRSDRGGGTVNVEEGSYTSNGYNSPAIYSTADITVEDADLTANNSEALVIEGKNSITLIDCDVTGNMSDTKGASSDVNVHNVMIYQSMSGDADVGTSEFSMEGGTLTSLNGDMIYVTNTNCVITLEDVELDNQDTDNILLRVVGNDASNGWGTAGRNGANAVFTAIDQELSGDILVDTISTLDFSLTDGSSFTGTINIVDNEEGGTEVDNNAVVTIEKGCTWTLTGDCTITSLTNAGTINYNGYTITLADGTVLAG